MTVEEITTVNEPQAESRKKVRDSTKWLLKTKLCVYSVQGSCRLGSKCSFAHSATEVQEAPNLHKTQLCEAFLEGKCTNTNCSFAHGEEDLRLSPNFKNKLCKWFEKGKCRNGVDCGFAHGADQLRHQWPDRATQEVDDVSPPPGLTLEAVEAHTNAKAHTNARPVLDLDANLLDAKAPESLEQQVEGMTSTIAALQWKMDDMLLRSEVSGMKQFLGQLSAQCAELEGALQDASSQAIIKDKVPLKKTPLRTALRSKAAPFQPSALSSKAQMFVPLSGSEVYDTTLLKDDSWDFPSDESTSIGSGGFTSD